MLLRGQASGVIQTVRQVGATLGIALMGTVVANVQLSQVEDVIARNQIPPAQAHQLEAALNSDGGGSGAAAAGRVPEEIVHELREAVTTAISTAYWVAAALLLIAALFAFATLRRQRAADADPDGETAYAAVG
jgi:predicted MFS family arabinose efflux permease